MQSFHLLPAGLSTAPSLQMISLFFVLEELGSDRSRSGESRHTEAHGEFGVTCSALASCVVSRKARRAVAVWLLIAR